MAYTVAHSAVIKSAISSKKMSLISLNGNVPYDAQVEYLESTNGQWIDSGVPLNTIYGMDIKFNALGSQPGQYKPFVVRSDSTFCFSTWQDQGFYIRYNGYHNGFFMYKLHLTTDESLSIRNGSYDFGFVSGDLNGRGNPFANSSNTLSIFGVKGWREYNVRIYSLSLYDANNTAIREYVPVRAGENGMLYDNVSNKLFKNGGTGAFLIGPDL